MFQNPKNLENIDLAKKSRNGVKVEKREKCRYVMEKSNSEKAEKSLNIVKNSNKTV